MSIQAEFIQTFALVSQQRAALYCFFSDWLAREREQKDLAYYQTEDYQKVCALLTACGLENEVNRFQAALNTALTLPDNQIEMAADFASSFLLAADYCATPYASWYLEADKRLYGDIEKRMRDFLKENALRLNPKFKEPADHLSVFLSLMAFWIEQNAESDDALQIAKEQAEFIQAALLNWLPTWENRCQKIVLTTDVYPALASLLLQFVQADLNYLIGE
ncbi:molecular chaperone TorD [Neisseriaceae bacterium B1]